MKLFGKYFTKEIANRIQEAISENPSISRYKLSQKVCGWLDWRSQNGKFKDVSCRKALLELDRKGIIRLPELKKRYNFQKSAELIDIPDIARVDCNLSELGKVELVPVVVDYKNKEQSRIWNYLMEKHHYLGGGPLCGAQIRYLIISEKYGYLGGMSYSSGILRMKDRDKWIGWSEAAHWANMSRVVCNSRFLILPTVNVKNLASHVLSLSIKRIPLDWKKRYGYSPVLLETFVDTEKFNGVCYRAANWELIGKTAGRSGHYANGKKCGTKKDIYVYPLKSNFRHTLCRETKKPLFSEAREENYTDWHEEEFCAVEVYDPRLKKRLESLAPVLYDGAGKSLLEACGSVPERNSAYRFFSHKEITLDRLLRPHAEASATRIRKHKVALAIKDSIELKCPEHLRSDDGNNEKSFALRTLMGLLLTERLWARLTPNSKKLTMAPGGPKATGRLRKSRVIALTP